MSVQSLFSTADLARIRAQVTGSESRHAAEIVPYLVGRVDRYPESRWRGAILGMTVLVMLAGVLFLNAGGAWNASIAWVVIPALAGGLLGYLLSLVPAFGRRLISSAELERRVRLRAEAAFLEEEVFRTRDRTGILLFVAAYEHRAVILADRGIHRAVPEGTWQQVIDELVRGIKSGSAVDAMCAAIEHCGRILESYEVSKPAGDEDELDNALRIRNS